MMSTQGDTEKKSTKAPTKPQADTNKQKSGNTLLGLFVFLTFLLAIAGIGAGYYVWQQTQQRLQAAEVERQALKHALGTLDENPRIQKFSHAFNKKIDATNSKVQTLGENIGNISHEQKRLATIVEDTSDLVGRSQNGWMLKEVEHVLRMSQHRLLLDRDFDGAYAGLTAADQRLSDLNNIRLVAIRKSIAKQTRTLKEFPHPDYIGIQLKLDNLIDELKNGFVKSSQTKSEPESSQQYPVTTTVSDQQSQPFDIEHLWMIIKKFISETLEKVKASLSDSVNITRGEQKIALFIEEQEKKRAYDFLHNKLLAAKYSVSTRDDEAFHQQLNAAIAWLENNDHLTNSDSLAKDIAELNHNNLTPALPDISEPSILLAKYMNTLKDKK